MSLVNKINKKTKYCLQNYKHFSCEMCPVRILAVSLTKDDPAKIRTCMYFITDKKFLIILRILMIALKQLKAA